MSGDKYMKNENGVSKSEVKAVLEGVKTGTVCRKKVTKHMLCSISKSIRSGVEYAEQISGKGSDETNAVCEWLCDNRYVFEKNLEMAGRSLKTASIFTCTHDGKPRYYDAFLTYYRCFDDELDAEKIREFASIINSEKPYPTIYDLYFLETLIRIAVLDCVAGVCDRLKSSSLKEDDAREIEKAVLSFRNAEAFRFEGVFEESPSEIILKSDPSGYYDSMTKQTKNEYRKALYLLSQKRGINEEQCAKEIIEKCKRAHIDRERHVGFYLMSDKKTYSRLYFVILFFTIAVVQTALFFVHPVALLALFPVWECVKLILDRVFSFFTPKQSVPSLEMSAIPDGSGVMCVITTLLTGEKNDGEIFDRLEKMHLSNGGKNVYFGVLADRTDSERASVGSDEEILNYAKKRILELRKKYGDVFFLFSRERRYSPSHKRFMAHERKRGAVNELCRYLCLKGDGFDEYSIKPDENISRSVKYCITLDADTNLPLGSVLSMTGAMLHPLNKPEINREKHVVTRGHGIMQPLVSTTLKSAGRTRFSRIMCGSGGTEIYSSAMFDNEQSLFGNAVFCGKGIFDKNAFYEVTSGSASIACDTVLSHDSIEGARLNCACLANVTLTDSFPKNELSYFKRAHRWIRGDVQNTVFLGNYVKNESGEVISNRISALYKFRIFENVRRALVPVFSVICVFAGVFLNENKAGVLLTSAVAYLFVPVVFEALYPVVKGGYVLALRRFFSKGVLTGLWQSFGRCIISLFSLAKSAIITLDALVRSLYRMFVSKKNMLEWVTAAQTDEAGKDGLIGYVYKNLFSASLGAALFIICPYGFARLLGLLWFFHPAFSYFMSLSGKTQDKEFSEKDKDTIRSYAEDIWKFFSENVTPEENFLPIDNIQFFPDTIKAHRTSPTNIGLYLVCTLCARDFGFIDSNELFSRLSDTIGTAEKMSKWNGHLYNWYDTQSLEVLNPKFVSGVDSGNLLACLICVYEGLSEYSEECRELEGVRKRIKALYDETDLKCIYDSEKELFCIGASFDRHGNSVLSDNKYDLLMSEARTLSYIAVAQRSVPSKHWESLSRMPVRFGDRIGLASWTGTAFEYFMPALFLPVVNGSLSYEALCFALGEQKKRRADTGEGFVWGISESAFFAFDYEMNYQYRAFGIPSLGLHRGLENDLVISPYSSFLSLCVSSRSALGNLKTLKRAGMYGRYGFYEAADFTKRRVKSGYAKVKSVMSHHAGMSMAACANACFDDILQKRFMSNAYMSAAQELLEEKIPVDVAVKKRRPVVTRENRPSTRRENPSRVFESVDKKEPVCSLLSDGKNRILLSSKGYSGLYHNSIVVSRADAENSSTADMYVLCEIDGEVFSCNCGGMTLKKQKYSFETGLGDAEYVTNIVTRDGRKFVFRVSFGIDSVSGNVFRISARLKSGTRKTLPKARFALCFEPVMMEKSAYEAHPAFASLFVESEYRDEENTLLFSRRKRSENDREMFLGVGLCSSERFDFASRKSVLCPLPVTHHFYRDVFKLDLSGEETGACESPYCIVRTDCAADADFAVSFGYDRESVLMNLALSRKKSFIECKKELSEKALDMVLGTKFYPEQGADITEEQRLLSAVIYPNRYEAKEYTRYENDMLWKHGISGDVPLFSAYADTSYLCEKLERYVRAFMLIRMKGVKCELVLFCRDKDAYFKKSENRIRRMLEKNGALGVLGKKNGIFIVNVQENKESADALVLRSSLVIRPSVGVNISGAKDTDTDFEAVRKKEYRISKLPEGAFASGRGFFLADGSYTVTKSENKRVYSHVLSGRHMSCVLDSFSLGYTFSRNAAERRITPFFNDAYGLESAEHVCTVKDGKAYDLCALSDSVRFFQGGAQYRGNVLGKDYTVNVFIPEKLPVKLVEVEMDITEIKLCFDVKPIMGRERAENRRLSFDIRSGCVTFTNTFPKYYDDVGFLFGFESGHDGSFCTLSHTFFKDGSAKAFFDGSNNGKTSFVFALGSAKSEQTLDFVMSSVTGGFCDLKKSACDFSGSFSLSQTLHSGRTDNGKCFSLFFDKWLPYQNGSCRFFARSGFYQSGGAFGFRDQLQDSLALMYSHPEITRAHIIRCCAHQFEEGDVLHWWHPCTQSKDHSHMGVRTRISDDYVFLPYGVSKYIEFTGDLSLLDVKVPYISAPELSENENEKYIAPSRSDLSESVYRHSLRSLTRACERTGEHGLCLIGAGDWCDGLNRIGIQGKGESVWLTMFLCTVLDLFSKICERYDDTRCAHVLQEKRKTLAESIEKYAFDYESGYYLRAFTDSGRKIGVSSENENRIELLPQAFSVFSHIGTPERRADALNKAFDMLYDRENRIMKLFSPAYKTPEYDPGYIKGYCEGFRENGGQYTHAAVWMMMSLMEMSLEKTLAEERRKEFLGKGLVLMRDMLIPLRMSNENMSEKYLAEPYVLSADIYSNPEHEGKGGWTWYTGSSGWLWRALLSYCLCMDFSDVMTEKPVVVFSENVFRVPYAFADAKQFTITLPDGKTTVLVKYEKSDKKSIVANGKTCGMKTVLEKGENVITVYSDESLCVSEMFVN